MSDVILSDLVKISLGLTHTPKYVSEGVPFLSVKNISQGFLDLENCNYITKDEFDSLPEGAKPQIGDMLFCRVGTLGKPLIIQDNTPAFGSFVSLGYLRNKAPDRLEFKYLYYWMYSKNFHRQIKENVKGASQANLNTGWLSKFKFPLPPLQTQQEIAQELDQISELITLRKQQLEKLDLLVKAKFVEMFGDPVENPMGWEEKVLSDVFEIIDGDRGANYPKQEEFYDFEHCLFLNTGNVSKKGFQFAKTQFITKEKDDILRKGKLKREDIVLTTRGTVGNLAYYANSIPYNNIRINSGMVVLRKKAEIKAQYFIISFPLSKIVEKFISGSAQPQLPITQLKTIKIPLPPLPLQTQFAQYVHKVEETRGEMEQGLAKLEMLFAERMQGYFG